MLQSPIKPQPEPRTTSPTLRKSLAVIATAAVVIGAVQVVGDNTTPGSGFSTMATVGADPSGPPGPTGGMTDGGGSQFRPPEMPGQQPQYQGGNQPPMNQDNGISIYQTGAQGAPQQGGQSGGQQQPQQGWDQPAHGTQPPNYSTAPGYTQGPGKPNPDFQAPQQPQQGQQPQAPTQAPTPQPTQPSTPDQNQWPDDKRPVDLQKGCAMGPQDPVTGACKWAPRATLDLTEEQSKKLTNMATDVPKAGFITSCAGLGALLAAESTPVGQFIAAGGAAVVCTIIFDVIWPDFQMPAGKHIQLVLNGYKLTAAIV
ncbi:TPA_asm: hypothetical protein PROPHIMCPROF_50 [Mycobacterium phage McProf]|nr:TPA_asm: hypothetical protein PROPHIMCPROF_50 [Mycobacterium phage McProf]